MRTFLVYAAGPITGASYTAATEWRNRLATELNREASIHVLSPMRAKKHLEGEVSLKQTYDDHPLSCARGIMTRDSNDCRRSDLIVVHLLGATRVSIGTVMEIAWAHAYRIPLVLIMEPKGNIHDHPMIREAAGYIVSTLEEAVAVIKAVLLP